VALGDVLYLDEHWVLRIYAMSSISALYRMPRSSTPAGPEICALKNYQKSADIFGVSVRGIAWPDAPSSNCR
jgi:hypothetical protein